MFIGTAVIYHPNNRSQRLGHPKLKTKEIPMCLTKNIGVSEADGRVRLGAWLLHKLHWHMRHKRRSPPMHTASINVLG